MADFPHVAVYEDRSTMSWSRRIDAPVETVWEAVTQKEHLDRWMAGLEAPQMELRLGGRHFWWTGDGTIDEFELLRVIRQRHGDGFPFMRYEMEPTAGGTRFTFTDRMNRGERAPNTNWEETAEGWRQHLEDPVPTRAPGGPGTHWVGVAAGWHSFVDALQAYIAGQAGGREELERLCKEHGEWHGFVGHDGLCEMYNAWFEDCWGEGGAGWDLPSLDGDG